MRRGWTRAPTDRERKTCGPSSTFHHGFGRRFRFRRTTGAQGDLAHFPARCEAVYPKNRPACDARGLSRYFPGIAHAHEPMAPLRTLISEHRGWPSGICGVGNQSRFTIETSGGFGRSCQRPVLAEDRRHPRILHRAVDLPGALDRAEVLSSGAGFIDASGDRSRRHSRSIFRTVCDRGDCPRGVEAAVVYCGVPRGHCRLLPRGPNAMAAMGLSVQLPAGGGCAVLMECRRC